MDIPVLLITFNRLDEAVKVLDTLRKCGAKKIFISSDGPRHDVKGESEMIEQIRHTLIKRINWECEVHTKFEDENLGCREAVIQAIDWVFSIESKAIILEDDCLPTKEFFNYCKWALCVYEDNEEIGLVSGSNLIDYKFSSKYRNGYSRYINIWGWATWANRWNKFKFHLSLREIYELGNELRKKNKLSRLEIVFWKNVFKHTALSDSIWDFYLQHHFFKYNLLSVYPSKNLVLNIGFGDTATHTNKGVPSYVIQSKPNCNHNIMNELPNNNVVTLKERDQYLIKTVWNYSPLSVFRMYVMNIIRFMK